MSGQPKPENVRNVTAAELYQLPAGFLLREWGQGDDAWVEVAEAGQGVLPVHDGKIMPGTVTVTLVNGDVRLFNTEDHVEVGFKRR
jgi:hypothetical protein